MKLKITGICVLLTVCLLSQPFGQRQEINTKMKKLTTEELSLLSGQGCSAWAWIAAVAGDIGCAVDPNPWVCLAALGTTADCISQLGYSSDPNYTGNQGALGSNLTNNKPQQ